MKNEDIISLPVKDIADKSCILFLWTTYAHLEIALHCINNWGFKYKTVAFEWFKKTTNGKPICFMGHYTCGGAIELCLLAKRGNIKRIAKNIRRLVISERLKHSQKPEEVRYRIKLLYGDLPRIELFARQKTEGWDVWGNEVVSDIDLMEL
jgi:site-specific DNA-methyltransferase (adenine-specific)